MPATKHTTTEGFTHERNRTKIERRQHQQQQQTLKRLKPKKTYLTGLLLLVVVAHIGYITPASFATSLLRTTTAEMTRIGVITIADDTAHAIVATPPTKTSFVDVLFLLVLLLFFFSVPFHVHCRYVQTTPDATLLGTSCSTFSKCKINK